MSAQVCRQRTKRLRTTFNYVSQRKNQAEHISFMNARKDWIKQHNEGGPDCKRLQSKKALMEAKKTLNVVRNNGGTVCRSEEEICREGQLE